MRDVASKIVVLGSLLEQPWTSLLDFGVTKKVKDSSGVLWDVVSPKDIPPTQKASRQ